MSIMCPSCLAVMGGLLSGLTSGRMGRFLEEQLRIAKKSVKLEKATVLVEGPDEGWQRKRSAFFDQVMIATG